MDNRRKPTSADLRRAVRDGNIYRVRELLQINIPQEADDRGNTPLHIAVDHHNFNITALLLEHGADRGYKNKNDRTPIELAIFNPTEASFKTVAVFADYPSNKADSYRYGAALIFLVHNKKYKEAIALLNAGADPNSYGLASDDSSVLHLIVQDSPTPESLKLLELLMKKGANRTFLQKVNEQQIMAIELAAKFNSAALKLFAKLPAERDDKKLFHSNPYKLLIIENCFEELRAYIRILFERTYHQERAKNLLAHLQKGYQLLQTDIDVSDIVSMLEAAINAFKLNRTFDLKNLPHFARPPKNSQKDQYNAIIEKYAAKLQIFKPLELEAKEELEEKRQPKDIDTSNTIYFNSASPEELKADSKKTQEQELGVVTQASPLRKNWIFKDKPPVERTILLPVNRVRLTS